MAGNRFAVISPHPPIMVPAVGGSRAQVTSASADALHRLGAALEAYAPDAVVLMSPHAPALSDAFAIDDSHSFEGSMAQFGDPTRHAYRGDPELAHEILSGLAARDLPALARTADPRLKPGWLDHATIVPLSFLDPAGAFPLVVLSLSYLPYADHRALGAAVASAADALGRKVAFVASGDLSHRLTHDAPAGYNARGAELDAAIVGLVEQGRLSSLMQLDADLVEAGGECGLRSIIAAGGFCCDDPAPVRVLAYEGPWGVGYLSAGVGGAAVDALESQRGSKAGVPGEDESDVVKLARASITAYLETAHTLSSPTLADDDLPKRAGAFVSLHRQGALRGCIGTILPTKPSLAEEVAANAIEAATRDPRFPPISADELRDLDVKVDVLHAPESCTIDELDPSSYGVIVTSGWRRGLLLPDLEGVDDVESQVAIAMSKAGIQPGEACAFERFKVDRYT